MKQDSSKLILLIDRQLHWREAFAHALRSVGFMVCTLDTYNYASPHDCLKGENPDLVVLGCVRIRPEEQMLIAQILNRKHHLLVLCVSLPWQVMRSLFLQGVDDIVEKPYDPADVVYFVNQALESSLSLNLYQVYERVVDNQPNGR
jgi:DNA-binding NtrC family response regulator